MKKIDLTQNNLHATPANNAILSQRYKSLSSAPVFALGFDYTKKLSALVGRPAHNRPHKLSSARLIKMLSSSCGQLRENMRKNKIRRLNFLIKNRFYKAIRLSKGLPTRGQRTHTNANTSRKLNSHTSKL